MNLKMDNITKGGGKGVMYPHPYPFRVMGKARDNRPAKYVCTSRMTGRPVRQKHDVEKGEKESPTPEKIRENMEMTEGKAGHTVKNRFGFEVVKCCASCAHKVIDMRYRRCGNTGERVASDGLCGEWKMSATMNNVGKSR